MSDAATSGSFRDCCVKGLGARYENHPDAQVERRAHLVVGEIALLAEKLEDRRNLPRRNVELRAEMLRKRAGKVLLQPSTGDMGRGQSLIVWAIAEGRAAAAGVDAHLTGRDLLPSPIEPTDGPIA